MSRLAGRSGREEDRGVAFMHGQDGRSVVGEYHQSGFPVAGDLAVGGAGRAVREGPAGFRRSGPESRASCRARRVWIWRGADRAASGHPWCAPVVHRETGRCSRG